MPLCGCIIRRALRDGEPALERERKEAMLPLLVAVGAICVI
eukprot:gene4782-7646_t